MAKRTLLDALGLLAVLTLVLSACGRQVAPTPTEMPGPTPSPLPTRVGPTPPPGRAAPMVVDRTPQPGAELPPDGAIELVFDQPMDQTSVEGALELNPPVAGSLAWADERTVRFKPARDLKRDAEYGVTLSSQAKAADGESLKADFGFDFRTVGFLTVSQVVPAPGAEDVEADSTITVVFNRPVVPLTAVSDPAFEGLPQPLILDPPVEGHGEWLNTSIYAFAPDVPLAGGTTYRARLDAGLTDATGGVLDKTYAWEFTTQLPQVTWVSPADEGNLVAIESSVKVAFNMPVDPVSAQYAFSLQGGGEIVDGAFEAVSETLVFTPTEELAFATRYTARVAAGVLGLRGGQGMAAAYEWGFTTVPLPRIVGTRPADGEDGASPHTPFEILFNTPIDPQTVLPNLQMTPPLSPTQIFTSFNPYDNVFRLDFGSEPSTEYEVRIGPGISDAYGNRTGQALTVRYRTEPLDPAVRFDVPGMIGTYDANQPAQISVGHVNVDSVNLRLYRLALDDYTEDRGWLYEPDVRGVSIRAWSELLEAPLNQRRHSAVALSEDGGGLDPGLYMLELRALDVDFEPWVHRRLLSVSEYNLTLKAGQDGLWAWATELATGRPAEGLALVVRRGDRQLTEPVMTAGEGVAHFSLASDDRHELYVVSEDPYVLGGAGWDWSHGIRPWDFGLEPGYDERAYRAYVVTDRPIYRAGQTVYFRGILRAEADVRYSLPTELTDTQVRIFNAEGEQIYDQVLSLDEFGAFVGEVTLDEGAALGGYRIEGRIASDRPTFHATFTVAAYRPPEFEVTVTPGEQELVAGRQTQAQVEVDYFFGGAVVDAEVDWRVLTAPYRFSPLQFGRYDFTDDDDPWICRWCWWRTPPRPEVILEGSGVTDAQGQLSVRLPTDIMTGGQRLTVEATAYGRDGQAISGRQELIVHRGDFYVGLAPQRRVGEAGSEVGVEVVTVDWGGRRVPEEVVGVEVYRREWISSFAGDEQGGRWESETEDTLVYTDTITTDQRAEGAFGFTPLEGGTYKVSVSGRDANGRSVRSSTWIWVGGAQDSGWRRGNDDRFNLVSDKSSYVPGETAEILIPSPFRGDQWAWITVERGDVLQQEVRRLASNSAVYRFRITEEHAPNVYVSVVIVKGPDATNPAAAHKMGILPLSVEPLEQTLTIALTPSVEQAAPGEKVSFDVQARDARGEPVRAAFSLDMVDKAVLNLKPRQEDAIIEAFYGRRGLGVSTSSGLVVSVNRLLLKQAEELENLARQGLGIGGGGGEMEEAAVEAPSRDRADWSAGEGLPPGVRVRKQFEDTALWVPGVVTDEQGRASVEVDLPDNLTTWVLRGIAVTRDTKVGEETTDLLVTKPLLVRPVTPRFLVVGDRAQLAALVSNNTGSEQSIEVTLQAEGLRLTQSASQRVTVPNGAEAEVTWWVEVEDVASVDVVMGAVAGGYADAARPRLTTGPEGTLLVHRYTAPEIVGTGGQLTGEGVRIEAVGLPPHVSERRGELSIRLDPSLAAGMTKGLDYLESHPYECTEQIVSQFLPNLLTYRAVREVGLSRPDLEQELPGLVAEALEKLYDRQNNDGGWGWWVSGESRAHLTAYVIFGMVKARRAGFEVRDVAMDRGLSYLRGELVPTRQLASHREANQQAFVLHVMTEAGYGGELGEFASGLYQQRDKLSHYGRAHLALTLHLLDAEVNRLDTLLADLQTSAILSATGAHWEEAGDDFWAMNTDTRSTAVILDALTLLDPENALIPNVVRWLMVARRDGIWETTYETSWALIALTDWMRVSGELRGNYDYALWLNDELLEEGSVTSETVDVSIERRVPSADLDGGDDLVSRVSNRVAIVRGEGEGRLYYTAHLRAFLPVEETAPLHRGIIVSRRYVDPLCDDDLKCAEVERAAVGDVVQVRLTIIAPHDLTYVVVEDPLPAGAEPIDPALATTSLVGQGPSFLREVESDSRRDVYPWWWSWHSRSEIRDDKVVLFADYLPAGTYEYTYTFRAVHPGEYHVIPTHAREFYFPEVFGRASGRLFTVEDE